MADDKALRKQLAALLRGGQAHAKFEDAEARYVQRNVLSRKKAFQ